MPRTKRHTKKGTAPCEPSGKVHVEVVSETATATTTRTQELAVPVTPAPPRRTKKTSSPYFKRARVRKVNRRGRPFDAAVDETSTATLTVERAPVTPRTARGSVKTSSPYLETPLGGVNRPPPPTARTSPYFKDLVPHSTDSYGLIQEYCAPDVWKLLVAVCLLNQTTGRAAIPVFWSLLDRWCCAEALATGNGSRHFSYSRLDA
jgi:hypothetical protein